MQKPILSFLVFSLLFLSLAQAYAADAKFSWDANPEAELVGYRLYYDSDMSGPPYDGADANEGPSPYEVPISSLLDPAQPTIELTGLTSCQTYYFAITAYTETEESDYSQEIEAVLVAEPRDVVATPTGPDAIQLSWTAPPADDPGTIPAFTVEYDVDAGEPYEGMNSPIELGSVNQFEVSGLNPNQTYYFVVHSNCNDGTSKASDEISATTQEEPVDNVEPEEDIHDDVVETQDDVMEPQDDLTEPQDDVTEPQGDVGPQDDVVGPQDDVVGPSEDTSADASVDTGIPGDLGGMQDAGIEQEGSSTDDGCGCQLQRSSTTSPFSLLLLLAGGVFLIRKRSRPAK